MLNPNKFCKMKKLFFAFALAVCMVMSYSCDKLNQVSESVTGLEKSVDALKKAIESGAVITKVEKIENGYKFTLSNSNSYIVTNGDKGEKGDSFFKNVEVKEDCIIMTLSDDTVVVLPLQNKSGVAIMKASFIPEYSDGKATFVTNASCSTNFFEDLNFSVSPLTAFDLLKETAKAGKLDVTAALYGLKTRSAADAPSINSERMTIYYGEGAELTIQDLNFDPKELKAFLSEVSSFALMLSFGDEYTQSCTDPIFVQVTEPVVEWGGVKYGYTRMADGNIWMAENLRYIPQGKNVADLKDDYTGVECDGIYYPATYAVVDGKAVVTPSSDASVVAAQGLLYTAAAAMNGESIPTTDWVDCEKTQGVCPAGWHIPTAQEWVDLVGACAASDRNNVKAPYYVKDLSGADLAAMNEDGFNLIPYPFVNQGKKYLGSYLNKRAESEYNMYASMCYFHSSTGRSATQNYAAMITNNNTKTSVNCAYNNLTNACAVRCMKNN